MESHNLSICDKIYYLEVPLFVCLDLFPVLLAEGYQNHTHLS